MSSTARSTARPRRRRGVYSIAMPARGCLHRLKRRFAIFMALSSLAIAIFWVDSYRDRAAEPLSREERESIASNQNIMIEIPDRTATIGVNFIYGDDSPLCSWVITFEGCLSLASRYNPVSNRPIRSIDLSWHDFAYRQDDWGPWQTSNAGTELGPYNHIRTREIWLPFWALFVLCAAYPAIYFNRGPLHRRRRRRRGLCIECGYDLSHSPGRCPECGAVAVAGIG